MSSKISLIRTRLLFMFRKSFINEIPTCLLSLFTALLSKWISYRSKVIQHLMLYMTSLPIGTIFENLRSSSIQKPLKDFGGQASNLKSLAGNSIKVVSCKMLRLLCRLKKELKCCKLCQIQIYLQATHKLCHDLISFESIKE